MQTQPSAVAIENKSNSIPLTDGPQRRVVKSLNKFFDIMGHKPEVEGSIAMMAVALCQRGDVPQIEHALSRCMKECRFPVRLPDIILRMQGNEVSAIEAEMRAQWDVVMKFVDKWVRWNSERDRACPEQGAPVLADRTLDVVRRTGGWSAYLAMDDQDFPFQQKRFFEEYQAWTAVEKILPDLKKLGAPVNVLQLVKPMAALSAVANVTPAKFRPIAAQQPLTDAEVADRRLILKQQTVSILERRTTSSKAAD